MHGALFSLNATATTLFVILSLLLLKDASWYLLHPEEKLELEVLTVIDNTVF